MADAGIALGVLVVGHSRPGEVHDVGADDRGLQQARTGVGCEGVEKRSIALSLCYDTGRRERKMSDQVRYIT